MKSLLLLFFIVQYISFLAAVELTEKSKWKYLEFDWDSEEDKQAAIDSGDYIQGASLPVDVDQFVKDEYDDNGDIVSRNIIMFVTVLRKPGVPATLTTITDKEGDGGPLLRPYPDWSSTKDCSGFTNVHRIAINSCRQLWILDSGKVDDDQICPAKLTVIDLQNDNIIEEMEVPKELIKGMLANIVVQPLDESCSKSAAYLADPYGNALIIYDGEKFCCLDGPEFGPEQDAETFTIGNNSITKETGVLGLALTPVDEDVDDQYLFFRPLASYYLYFANTKDLREYCTTGNKPTITKENTPLPSQSVSQVIDNNEVFFYNSIRGTSVNCWNIYKKFVPDEMVILAQDAEKLQWVSGMKASPPDGSLATLLVLSNRYQKFEDGTMNTDEVNFRVLQANTYLATYGTECMD